MTFALLTGIVSACSGPSEETGPVVAAVPADDAAGGGATPARPAAHAPQVRSRPVKVAVPAIFIEAAVTPLGLDKKGQLGAPSLSAPMTVGWHRHGPSPGDAGTAVLVGHRDTATGPAIFLNLKMLRRGDAVKVTRADRRVAVFTVDEVKTYTKDKFPNSKVYGHVGRPELRLITCGGRFDKKHGYSANVVVFAHLTSLKKQGA
ncbi:class F sortase [Streptomyces sp. NPDC013457]|uniref:class F sortase n=1 Tax=Streptomyces sp. NPDC013457 TaxID=3364866 RepID=UPI00370004C5